MTNQKEDTNLALITDERKLESAKERNPVNPLIWSIKVQTKGIVFRGTPHTSTSSAMTSLFLYLHFIPGILLALQMPAQNSY